MTKKTQADIVIPEDVSFSDLDLERDPDGSVRLDWGTIERICQASNVPVSTFRDGPEDNLGSLIMAWYDHHLQGGGNPDPVMDDLIRESEIEKEMGQPFSYKPGRA